MAEERAVEIEKFFSENPWPMAGRIVKQNCEAIRLNARWLQRDGGSEGVAGQSVRRLPHSSVSDKKTVLS